MNTIDSLPLRLFPRHPVSAITIVFVLLLVLTFSTSALGTSKRKIMDVGAVMPDFGTAKSQSSSQLVFTNPIPFEFDVTLPTLTSHERKKIADPLTEGPQQIGIHREVPYHRSGDLSNKLTWKKDGDGVVAYLRVRSPEAESIRFSAQIKLPAHATITFYGSSPNSQSKKVVYSFTAPKKGFNEELYWSPHAMGDSIGIEIRLPRPSSTGDVKLSLLQIAHRFKVPNVSVVNALDCSNHEEVQCAIDNGEISESNARAALRIVYESEGVTRACSATLMNVSGDGEDVYIPYVITAGHCVSTDDEAASVIAWWNYQTTSCGGGATSADFSTTFGGADLLATTESYDQSLIRLNEDPPAGVSFSGWWVTDVSSGVTGSGAHHPAGVHKKFFSGTTQGNFNVNVCFQGVDCFLLLDAIEVGMDNGASEGGSSGAGLRIYNQDEDDALFVGVLSASDSKCDDSSVYFAEFRHFYDSITTWFDPEPPPPATITDDHGNSEDTATLVGLVSTTEGELEEAGDVDYFEVDVERRGTIQVYTSGSLDTVGQLTSAQGDVDVTDDDSGDSTNFLLSVELEPGIYYIRVEGYSDATGNYTLHVEFEDSDDHGDTRSTATTVSSSARAWEYSTVGHLDVPSDVDVFEITLSSNSTITINTEGDTDTTGRLTDYNGFDLFENDDTDENNSNFTLSGFVEVGTYFLFVEGFVTNKSEYTLKIDVTQE